MKILGGLLIAALTVLMTLDVAGCTPQDTPSSGPGKPITCPELEKAMLQFNDLLTGVKNETVTNDDAGKTMASIASKLKDSTLDKPADYTSAIEDGILQAGRLRVQVLSGTGDNTASNALADDMDTAYAFCK